MTNYSAPSVPANMGTPPSNTSDFNKADQVDWLVGVSSKPQGAITCTYGSKRSLSAQSAPYGTGTSRDTLFSLDKGWGIVQSNGSGHWTNFELSFKDKSRWCPAAIFNGFGGLFKQHHNKKHSMYYTDLALIFMNRFEDKLIYASDGKLSNSKGEKTVYYRFSTQAYIDEIRKLGVNWLFYGVILRIENSGSGAGSDSSECSCSNFRVFTKGSTTSSSHRLIVPQARDTSRRAVAPVYMN